jgi:hypothetical protein
MVRRTVPLAITALLTLALASCDPSGTGPSRSDPGDDDTAIVPCPDVGPPIRIGEIGTTGRGVDPIVAGISGLGVSTTERDGDARIAWAVGDRSANEIAGPDSVFVFALDARDGRVVERFAIEPSSLEPGPAGDPVTSVAQTESALPDLEELAIEPGPTRRIWLFDTGDNDGTRTHLNVYVIDEPRIEVGGHEVEPTRFPIQVVASEGPQAANVEGAFVDPASEDATTTVYLIPKFPVDLDGDGAATDFRVFSFEPEPESDAEDENGDEVDMDEATEVGHVTLNDPALRITAASASQDGTAFAVRAVSGGEQGQPNLDVVALWQREPFEPVGLVIGSRPTPDCTWSFDTAKGSSSEETLAFDLARVPAWSGFLWTHDQPEPGAPLFAAERM